MATANQALVDEAIQHRIYVLRHETEIYRQLLLRFLNELDADLVLGITKRITAGKLVGSGSVTTRKMQQLSAWVGETTTEMTRQFLDGVTEPLQSLAEYEGSWQAGAIARSVPIELNVVTPAPELLRAVVTGLPLQGRYLKDWVSQWGDAKEARVTQEIRLGLSEGQSADQIATRIAGTRAAGYTDGVLEISRAGALGLVRTASNSVTTEARETLYEHNADIVKGVRWVATLDSRTTPICRALDGTVFPVHEGRRPPAHFRCRSTTAPVLKSFKEMGIDLGDLPIGTRPAVVYDLAGDVPATETYGAWLRRQSAKFQDDVLGPSRGKLFRDGGLKVDRFVDMRSGDQWTLDELKKREPAAFKKAFG